MCGIVGYVSKEKWNLEEAVCSINHRGPDYQNNEIYSSGETFIGFGHARLSIIDLDAKSHQPLQTQDDNYSIIYNGEIYNYKALQESLKENGNVQFKTSSDTEVLLNYYKEFGIDKLCDLEGMFAFSIYDREKNELILARDQLGIKPLYYWHNSDGFFWASELKAIWNLTDSKPPISDQIFEEYLSSGFVYEPNTGYKNVYKVPPGSFVKISLDTETTKIKPKAYWKVNRKNTKVDEVKKEITSSINSHLVSDVPVGLFFSGGVDSTVILSKVKRDIKSFIVKSDKEESKEAGFVSDYEYGREVAKHLDADLEVIPLNQELNSDSILDSISKLAKLSEEPISDFTFISSMLLSYVARDKGYKVMLSGLGADELFAGYPRYRLVKYGNYFKWLFPLIKPFMRFSKYLEKKVERFTNYYNSDNFIQRYTALLTPFSREEVSILIKDEVNFDKFDKKVNEILSSCPFNSDLKKAMYLDLYGFLSHNFLVADKSSMQAGLELRVPLATPKLFEMCMNIPDNKLMNVQKTKLILKNILYEILPKKLVDRKKTGFNPPLDKKINDLGKNKILNFVDKNGLYEIINRSVFEEIVDEHFDSGSNNTFKIYRILYLSAWFKENANHGLST